MLPCKHQNRYSNTWKRKRLTVTNWIVGVRRRKAAVVDTFDTNVFASGLDAAYIGAHVSVVGCNMFVQISTILSECQRSACNRFICIVQLMDLLIHQTSCFNLM